MEHLDYIAAKKVVLKGLLILGIVTLVEVFIALLGNGHIVQGFELPKLIMYPVMIVLSLYKAYFIVFEFMHMRYEVRGLALSILLPTLLLVWAIIAFMQEGNAWKNNREKKNYEKSELPTNSENNQHGFLETDIKQIELG